jgi:ribosomal protein S18 acetylase RimI-like enzyme
MRQSASITTAPIGPRAKNAKATAIAETTGAPNAAAGREAEEGEAEVTFDIRKARAEDAAGIIDVLKHADFLNQEYRTGEQLPGVRTLCDQGAFWLAEQNGEAVSVIEALLILDLPEHRHFEIPILVTRAEFQRRGLARRLLCKVMVEAAALGAGIGGYAQNEKSANLLTSEGFCAVEGCVDRHGYQKYERRKLNASNDD